MAVSRTGLIVAAVVILIVGFAFGFLLSYTGVHYSASDKANKLDKLTRDADDKWSTRLLNMVDPQNIRTNLRKLTEHPHIAGSPASKKQAEELAAFWKDLGIKSSVSRYHALLSFPDKDNPNRIELQDGRGRVLFTTQLHEKILRPEQNQSDVVPPYNAYSAPGTPKGDLVYVNYGRIEDFTWLKETKNMDFSGKICIARYGHIFRGEKANHAELFGASGLILYSDPADYAQGDHETYPKTWWLPASGVQRGSLKIAGDPLTPGYPSIDSAYRIPESEAGFLTIPVHPISYGDAHRLLQHMAGEAAPADWQGSLNFTYKLGPGFAQPDMKVQMFISTHNKEAEVYNAYGVIKGTIEPDRYVLLGNHRDAWVFGAIDPSSGTASMMELSRVMATMRKEGWKPRRTIVFCSWAAEEMSLIGSKEFVEEYRQMLSSRAVAYLNVDLALDGMDTLLVRALPLLVDTVRDVAKKIPNPHEHEILKGRTTVFDTMVYKIPELDENGKSTGNPIVPILGSGSDFDPFIVKTGVTCADMRYHFDATMELSSYPVYHSVYETFHLVDEIMDPGFKIHKAVTQYWGELARRLVDYLILPLKVTDYAQALKSYANAVETKYGVQMRQHGLSQALEHLGHAMYKLLHTSEAFESRLKDIDKTNPVEVRMYNDQVMQLERVFIDPLGLPGRKHTKNVVFAPSTHNTYAGASFPALVDSLYGIEKASGDEEVERWEDVKKQLSIVTYFIYAAADILNPYDDFSKMRPGSS